MAPTFVLERFGKSANELFKHSKSKYVSDDELTFTQEALNGNQSKVKSVIN